MKPCKDKKIIGITGGIATGKSTVSNMLKEKGFKVIDSDKIAHEVMKKDGKAYIEVVDFFGDEILLSNKEIDRKKLGNIVFKDEKKLNILNDITHPIIMGEIRDKSKEVLNERDIVFLDVPLLIEQRDNLEKYDIFFDEVVLVYINKEYQLKRLIKRDGLDKENAINVIKSQEDIDIKRQKSDYIIDNSGDLIELEKEIDKMLKKLVM